MWMIGDLCSVIVCLGICLKFIHHCSAIIHVYKCVRDVNLVDGIAICTCTNLVAMFNHY